MKSLQEIESFIDTLPASKGMVTKKKSPRKKPVWRTVTILGISLSVILVAVLALTGIIQFLVVLSGSMHPTFQEGDVILTIDTPVESLKINDIITYRSPQNSHILITHRIIDIIHEKQTVFFQTQGDANEEKDPYIVSSNRVIGRMLLTFPYVGYVAQMSRSVVGFLLLVLIPGLIIIYSEVISIVKKKKSYKSY